MQKTAKPAVVNKVTCHLGCGEQKRKRNQEASSREALKLK
jgi:hypothetical protein